MVILKDNNVTLLKLEQRIKKEDLIKKRAEAKGFPHDTYGFRLILKTKEACYITGRIIKGFNTVCRYRDYISNPWSDGYQSIHIDLKIGKYPVEIQLRTQRMDALSKKLIEEKGQKYWKTPSFRKHGL